ncbi:aminoacetone oxidase family FAD-binding enzyme [Candidatus Peribacteria bacterium]|nr:aminoacetone oxidase family FAD-binding enzyme [Candidatus Peribacteria bacterium]
MHFDVAVIGGGPAGMMAAGKAADLGATVVLLEKNTILGKKLLISGGGRCNILNAEFDTRLLTEKYGKKGKALFSAFSHLDVQATIDFFESHGLPIKVEAEKRAFPKSDSAEDVQKTLIRFMQKGIVKILLGTKVTDVKVKDGSLTSLVTNKGLITASQYILATGGKSHPETGSTGDGFVWMNKLGHTVSEPDPALVPVLIRNPWVKDAAGISLKGVKLSVIQNGKKHHSRAGKMLFTHTGISGPLVLNMSKGIGELLKAGAVTLSLDLFPALDTGALDRKLLNIFEAGKNRMIKNNIGEIVQPRLGHVLLMLAGIDGSTPLHQLTREQRMEFSKLLKDIPLSVSGLLGAEDAIVAGGGVSLKEIDFKTMRSKLISNLFLTGDMLDFDRPSGGFSLQICWTTGYSAGQSAHGALTEAKR